MFNVDERCRLDKYGGWFNDHEVSCATVNLVDVIVGREWCFTQDRVWQGHFSGGCGAGFGSRHEVEVLRNSELRL